MGDVRTLREGAIDIVVLSGEHDLTTVAVLDEAVAASMSDNAASCLLDLSAASFIDSAVIATLVRWSKEAQVSQREALAIVAGELTSVVSRTLNLVGLLGRLPVFQTRDAAIAALEDGQRPRPQRPLRWLSDRELADSNAEALRQSTSTSATARDEAAGHLDEISREQQQRQRGSS